MCDEEYYWYWGPYLDCKNVRANPRCEMILLPAFLLSDEEVDRLSSEKGAKYPPGWPSVEWKAIFACTSCGHVCEYTALDVGHVPFRRLALGKYRSSANVFRVEISCANRRCKAQAKLYVAKNGADVAEVANLLRNAFFIGSLPCGHAIPSRAEKIEKVMEV